MAYAERSPDTCLSQQIHRRVLIWSTGCFGGRPGPGLVTVGIKTIVLSGVEKFRLSVRVALRRLVANTA